MTSTTAKSSTHKSGELRLSPRWVRWNNEVEGVRDFLDRLARKRVQGGEKWCNAMKKHYTQRLRTLLGKEPKQYIR